MDKDKKNITVILKIKYQVKSSISFVQALVNYKDTSSEKLCTPEGIWDIRTV